MSGSGSENGYVEYFAILGLSPDAKPGDVRKAYKRKMKDLVMEIARVQITEDRRARFLLEMAQLNAALCLLRDTDSRDAYWHDRQQLIDLENRWREAVEQQSTEAEPLRRDYERRLRDFLSHYVEDLMLTAGRDKEAVEASNWNRAHERHASRILREYRNLLYQQIRQRMPYHDVTRPQVDWDERRATVAALTKES
jgi:hypothetical protein